MKNLREACRHATLRGRNDPCFKHVTRVGSVYVQINPDEYVNDSPNREGTGHGPFSLSSRHARSTSNCCVLYSARNDFKVLCAWHFCRPHKKTPFAESIA